jgi:ABC-type transporter Mla subunit MlaD
MPGDIESNMKFIVEQQAQFAADMEALKDRQAQAQRQIDENRIRIGQLVDVTMSLARHAEETDRILRELGSETDRRFRETDERFKETGLRLNALIDTVDKLVRRNGS